MDGYAVRFADFPGPFRLIGESAAGRPFLGPVGDGETVRIFTGAAVPAGADTVLIQEEATREGETIRLSGEGPRRQGSNLRPRGLDFHEGDRIVAKGDRLSAARVAVAAIAGHIAMRVNRRIRVAIAATGDELAPLGTIDPNRLPESNGVMLAAMLADLPVEIVDMGVLPDHLETIRDAFAAVQADLIVTSGGASVGDHDLVRPALEAAGGSIEFWRIALRPGKPMLAGRIGDALLVGLPGNPVSAFVTATLFVRPLIAALGGARDPISQTVSASLAEPLPANDHRADYLRATLTNGRVSVASIQDSSMLLTLSRANCLIVRPPHAPAALVDEIVDILPLA
jgi:molybdopterin molybdotransferase